MRLDYDTTAGMPTEGATFAQLTEYLVKAEECCYTLGHIRKANDDRPNGQHFINVGQKLAEVRRLITHIATQFGHVQ